MWYLYILKCSNGSFYTGITQDLKRRFEEHRSGTGGHYTKSNRAEKIVYSEALENQVLAEKRGEQIKRWSRAKKISLIQKTGKF